MYLRSILAVLTVTIILAAAGCEANPSLNSIAVTPSTAALSAVGQTVQLTATGTYVHGSHPNTTQDITDDSQWTSSVPSVATVSSTGLVTAVATGTTTITASKTGSIGIFSGTATVTVSTNGLVSIAIIPPASSQSLTNPGETSQFIAIGTFSGTPATMDLTDQVTWESSDVSVATINSAGLATAGIVAGETTITAIYPATPAAGVATVTGTSTLTVSTGGPAGQLPTLAVFNVGLGVGTVTSSPVGITCTPATTGSGCTGNFPLNQVVTLTAIPGANSQFGGWSSNCVTVTANTCSITMSTNAAGQPANEAVGAIFNLNP